ncbi:MAG: putative permease, superfamily [Chloroflexi bacterium]|nr:putative permease, superfamily [Chloroflexota bacterium]
MNRPALILTTALAPALWGTTYLTTTYALPAHHPLFTALMRALPVGLLITLIFRQLPRGVWWWRAAVLGALNIGLTFALLFIGAYRLPGGVAATISSTQPLMVALLGWPLLSLRPARQTLTAGLVGIVGVGMLVLGGHISLDPIGVFGAATGGVATAAGVVMVKRWGRPEGVSVMAFTGWQLVAGAVLLLPLDALFEGAPSHLSTLNVGGYLYLCLIGTALAYSVWFRGIGKLPASSVAFLTLLIPLVATIAGFIVYRQSLSPIQLVGMATVLGSIISAQRPTSQSRTARVAAKTHAPAVQTAPGYY